MASCPVTVNDDEVVGCVVSLRCCDEIGAWPPSGIVFRGSTEQAEAPAVRVLDTVLLGALAHRVDAARLSMPAS